MLLLERERQGESLDGKRNLLWIVVETEQIQPTDKRLHAALELTYTLLLTCVVLNDVRDDLATDTQLLKEMHLPQSSGHEVVLRDNQLLLEIKAAHLDVVHTIAQNGIHPLVVVVAEDEQTATQIQVNAAEVLVLEAIVLAAIRQMDQQVVDLLTLGRLRDLV